MLWIRRPSGAAALIDPARGGTVHRLALMCADEAVEILAGDAMGSPTPSASPDVSPRDAEPTSDDPGLFRGRLLVPFNDRIHRGRYSWRGTSYRLPINDSDQGDAIHGFLYRTPLILATRRDGAIELNGRIEAQPGYPFPLEVRLTYVLKDSDFSFDLTVVNRGGDPAPVALGWHPYFTLPGEDGPRQVDDLFLRIPAERYIAVDRELVPTGSVPTAAGTEHDFRVEKPVGEREIDLAWVPDDPRNRPVTLSDGRYRLQLFMGGAFRLVQVYIPADRRSIAMEPVSAAADSFNRHDQRKNEGNGERYGCMELAPGANVRARAVVALTMAGGEKPV